MILWLVIPKLKVGCICSFHETLRPLLDTEPFIIEDWGICSVRELFAWLQHPPCKEDAKKGPVTFTGIAVASNGEPLFNLIGFSCAVAATTARAFKSVLQVAAHSAVDTLFLSFAP